MAKEILLSGGSPICAGTAASILGSSGKQPEDKADVGQKAEPANRGETSRPRA